MGENSSVTATPPPPPGKSSAEEDALLKQFFAEVSEVERDNEVNRILSCFKLNPFEYLNMSFDSSIDDVKKQYRKLSLLVHPDKCKHPQAKEAFGALAKAQQLLLDPQERDYILNQVNAAKGLEGGSMRPLILVELQVLLALLYGQDRLQPSCDSWRWGLRDDGLFTVKSFYQSMLVREETTFPHSSIWIPRAPTKVFFFAWLAARGVILTAENPRKRGITLVSWCYMCKSSGKKLITLCCIALCPLLCGGQS
ncbi:uncharacterized protein [Nicotiana tomentosiformis]|uniref:uncharacterized protein isoform X6 n=1 Tax=Nicotiana tomentosiformis TaxID=4098 RepID=UPI00388C6B68